MATAALVVSLLALALALSARRRNAAVAARAAEDVALLRARVRDLAEETRDSVQGMRELLAQVASGAAVTPEMIREGRLWRDVTAQDAAAMLQRGDVRVVDVRTPMETAQGRIPGALHIPIDELEDRADEIPRDDTATVVYCAGGARSAAACEMLSRRGWAGLHNLVGGFGAWRGPVERPAAGGEPR